MLGAGKDCTDLFEKFHRWVNIDTILSKSLVGILIPDEEEIEENTKASSADDQNSSIEQNTPVDSHSHQRSSVENQAHDDSSNQSNSFSIFSSVHLSAKASTEALANLNISDDESES
jgi:hypothetical protein